MGKALITWAVLFWIVGSVKCQDVAHASWEINTESWYDSLIGIENSMLIRGKRHQLQSLGRETHPFFGGKKPFAATLMYQGQLYRKVPILYDIYQDALILYYVDRSQLPVMISLEPQDVAFFEIEGHRFERIQDQPWMNEAMGKGYVEILFEGNNASLIAKRQKLGYASKSSREFSMETWYYVRYLNRITPIASKRHLGSLFPNYRTEISSYSRRNRLKIRSDREEDMIQLVRFCDTLVEEAR